MVDLHVHTNYSDGKYSVKELLIQAEKAGLKVLSISDHDSIEAYEELKNMDVKKYYSGKIITGVEFSIKYKGKLFHMLGYNFDVEKMKQSKFLDKRSESEIIQEEKDILNYLIEVCKKMNIKLSDNLDILHPNDQANEIVKNDMKKYEENTEKLDQLFGKDRKISFWRGHITNPESPFFIDFTKNLPTPEEAANEIHNAGGLVVLPHVFEYKSIDNIQFLEDMYNLGILDGIECIHNKHTEEKIEYLKNYCKDKNLFMTGGSDFHSEEKQTLGYGNFRKTEITDEYFEGLKNKIF